MDRGLSDEYLLGMSLYILQNVGVVASDDLRLLSECFLVSELRRLSFGQG